MANLRTRLVLGDALTIAVAWAFAVLVGGPGRIGAIVAVASVVVVSLANEGRLGLFTGRISSARSIELSRLGKVAVSSPLPLLLIGLVVGRRIPVLTVVAGVVFSFIGLIVDRSAADAWLREQRRQGRFCRREVVVGTGDEARRIAQVFADHPELGRRVIGMVGAPPAAGDALPAPWLGSIDEVIAIVRRSGASGAFVASEDLDSSDKFSIIEELQAFGIHVHLSSGLFGIASKQVKAAPIMHEPMLYIQPPKQSRWEAAVKRLFDVVVAAAALIAFAPVLAVAAAAVRLTSGRGVLFRQERVGRDGSTFRLLKLRTMVVDAEARLAEVQHSNKRVGPLLKVEADPRVTRIGRILRASSIDELPQLVNVLRGDMSLVGPRPALAREVAQFDEALLGRHAVRPGITGLWQVEARENPSFGPYRRLDLLYANSWSFTLDLVVLVLTVQTVIVRILRRRDA